jgi:hypothetical protein
MGVYKTNTQITDQHSSKEINGNAVVNVKVKEREVESHKKISELHKKINRPHK